ncbi:MAG TPA: hypothetical protein VKV34_07365 [Thermoleophilia bacterium]|nr:hypothetical protein [Thermoleophilia bacterium]
MEDDKSRLDRVIEAAGERVSRVGQDLVQSPVVTATRDRANAVAERAQKVALSQMQVATREDVARLQASLDRIEAVLADLAGRVPAGEKPRPRSRTKPPAES